MSSQVTSNPRVGGVVKGSLFEPWPETPGHPDAWGRERPLEQLPEVQPAQLCHPCPFPLYL